MKRVNSWIQVCIPTFVVRKNSILTRPLFPLARSRSCSRHAISIGTKHCALACNPQYADRVYECAFSLHYLGHRVGLRTPLQNKRLSFYYRSWWDTVFEHLLPCLANAVKYKYACKLLVYLFFCYVYLVFVIVCVVLLLWCLLLNVWSIVRQFKKHVRKLRPRLVLCRYTLEWEIQ